LGDEDFVRKIFVEEDAMIILSIPVHPELEDVVSWHYDSRGLFSVWSTYKVQRDFVELSSKRGEQPTSHGTYMEKDLWKGVWKFKYLGKVRHFLWHFAHNSRALHMGLERRGMDFDTKCVMCGRLNEDGSHLFFKCKRVIRYGRSWVWSLSELFSWI
jgi:hypothetical protein